MLRVTHPDDALARLDARLGPTARIHVPGCAGEPLALAAAWRRAPQRAAGRTFLGVWIPGVNRTDYAGLDATAASELIFLAPEHRASFEAGRARLRPLSYMQAWQWLGATPLDAATIQVSPPDARGEVSLGVSADFALAVLQRKDVPALAHVNPEMPAPPDSPRVSLERFEIVFDTPAPLLEYDPGEPQPALRAVAEHIARFVDDGATLQFGLGDAQTALLRELAARKKKNLKIHSGMISDGILGAIDADAIADEPGAITVGVALGGRDLYARCARDRRFRFRPVAYTHAQETLAGIPRLIAVNSAIEVDLFGQANAEYLGGRQVSGAGGLVDFLRGAMASPGGAPVIALASTARGGAVSRIVPRLEAPSVSVSRADAGLVVTEFGVADLRGRTIEERAAALISIAHPDFRKSLADAWARQRASL